MTQNEKIIIVEDDRIVREYLKNLIENKTSLSIEAEFENAEDAMVYVRKNRERVIKNIFLVDIHLPGMSGIEFVENLNKDFDANCIILTVFDDDKHVFNSIKAGALGYILKNDSCEKIIDGIQDIIKGGSPINGRIARRILKEFANIPNREWANILTVRENQVLELLAKGQQIKEISTKLFISKDTVKTHVKNIYKKLHVNSKKQLMTFFNKL